MFCSIVIPEPRLLLSFCSAIPRTPPFSTWSRMIHHHTLTPSKRMNKQKNKVCTSVPFCYEGVVSATVSRKHQNRAAETRIVSLSHVTVEDRWQALFHAMIQGSRLVRCSAILSTRLSFLGLRSCSNDCLFPARGRGIFKKSPGRVS